MNLRQQIKHIHENDPDGGIQYVDGNKAYLSESTYKLLLISAKIHGVRGAGSKKKRIQRKVTQEMFNQVLRDYVEAASGD